MYTLLGLQGCNICWEWGKGGLGVGVVGVTIFEIVCWMFGNTGMFSPSDTCILSGLLSFSIGLHRDRLDTRQESSFFSIQKGKQRAKIWFSSDQRFFLDAADVWAVLLSFSPKCNQWPIVYAVNRIELKTCGLYYTNSIAFTVSCIQCIKFWTCIF